MKRSRALALAITAGGESHPAPRMYRQKASERSIGHHHYGVICLSAVLSVLQPLRSRWKFTLSLHNAYPTFASGLRESVSMIDTNHYQPTTRENLMKKRNVIIAAAVTAVIGSGIAFAGAKHCRDAGAGWHGNFGENKIEHIVDRLDSHLDLTDQQELSLRSILEENKAEFFDAHQARKSFRLEIMQLDPSSSDYDAAVASLADEFAAQVRQKTLQAAEIVKQASAVLTDEQLQKVRDLIEQRMDKYGHHKVDGNSQS